MREHILGQSRKFYTEDEIYKLTVVSFKDTYIAVVRADFYNKNTGEIVATYTVQMHAGELADAGFDI